jgi:hypothetical protein
MSGGISAIKGFDYQATVILDRLLDHRTELLDRAWTKIQDIRRLNLFAQAEAAAFGQSGDHRP